MPGLPLLCTSRPWTQLYHAWQEHERHDTSSDSLCDTCTHLAAA